MESQKFDEFAKVTVNTNGSMTNSESLTLIIPSSLINRRISFDPSNYKLFARI